MTFLVVGGGAVGSLLAWALTVAGRDIAVVRRGHKGAPSHDTLTVVDRDGIRHPVTLSVVGRPDDLPTAPEAIIFAVKMYDLAAAVASCAAFPDVTALTVENGIGAEALVAGARPAAGLIAASLTAAVELIAPGELRWLTSGGLSLAPGHGAVEPELADLASAFRAAGLQVRRCPEPTAMKWSKLLGNLLGNATGALLDLDVGRIYQDSALFNLERSQILEVLAVMGRLGVRPVALAGVDIRWLAAAMRLPSAIGRPVLARVVGGARGGKDPSLRVQVRFGHGPSEVEWLNGAVVRAGETVGLATPVNRALTELFLEALDDPARRAWLRARPDRLLAAVAERGATVPR